jgi:hypothetical protein
MGKNQNNKVEDIFEATDRTAEKKSSGRPPVRPSSSVRPVKQPPAIQSVPMTQPVLGTGDSGHIFGNRRFIVAGIALIVVLLAAGAMAAWRGGLFNKSATDTSDKNTNSASNVIGNTASTTVNISPINTGPTDTDGDGLTDTEEKSLGTDITKADTDGDGLFDREEVKVYKTDPLKKDTDGDGIDDGTEVRNGYNPNGSGKLFDLTNALSNTNK